MRVRLTSMWSGVLLIVAMLGAVPSAAQEEPMRFLGEYTIPSKSLEFEGTMVGGLSGVTYDMRRDVYYVISDDRGEFGPARFYTMKLDIGLDGIRNVRFLAVTPLDSDADTPGIQAYDANDSDTEEIVLLPDDTLLVSSERDRNNRPWLRRFALDGSLLGELQLPDMFMPASAPDAQGRSVQTRGTRTNLAFEGVTLAPDEGALYVINEEALAQDGPVATTSTGTLARLLRFNLSGSEATPGRQAVYRTEKIFAAPVPTTQAADNGVSSMLWSRGVLPQFDFLVMERAFATGVGNDVNIYGVRLSGADEVSSMAALPQPFNGRTVEKTLLVNMAAAGVTPDNLEGMSFGPRLPNGRTSLIVISDDNFNDANQIGQFLLFEVGSPAGK